MADPAPADWRASLPDDLKGEAMFKDIPDVPTLAKVARDAKHALGSSVRLPGPDASPDDRKAFRDKMLAHDAELQVVTEDDRAPKDAKAYVPPKEYDLPESLVEALRARAVARGLTKKQWAVEVKEAAEAHSAAAQVRAAAQGALKKELGEAFNERLGALAATAERLGFPGSLVESLKAGTVDMETFRAMAAVSKGFGEARPLADQGSPGSGQLTPDEAKMQLAELRGRKEFWDGSLNPALHEQLKRKSLELTRAAYPG